MLFEEFRHTGKFVMDLREHVPGLEEFDGPMPGMLYLPGEHNLYIQSLQERGWLLTLANTELRQNFASIRPMTELVYELFQFAISEGIIKKDKRVRWV